MRPLLENNPTIVTKMRQVEGEELESKDGEVMMVQCSSVYIQVYVLYNILNILSNTATMPMYHHSQ